VKFGVFGAGAIGTYVGVKLSSVGHSVVLIGRRWLMERKAHFAATNIRGFVSKPIELEVSDDPNALRDADVIIVTTKSMDTPSAVTALRSVVRRDTLVVSLQNGLHNAEVLRALPADVIPAMVGFNVIWDGARLEQATGAPILFGPSSHPGLKELVGALHRAKEKVGVRRDIDAVQMGKLLINLNNGICAVAGLPIAEMVRSNVLRRAYSICIDEGLRVAKKAGRAVGSLGVLSPWLVARLLLIPDPILFRLAPRIIAIDPRARSSTLQDLDRKKKTEIDFLNGEIVKLAREHGVAAPANAFITESVHRLEETQGDLQFLSPADVLRGVVGDHGRSPETTNA
jgi:2-dehydropantoate 2-reductase